MFDSSTGIYCSNLPDVSIPPSLSFFDFLFDYFPDTTASGAVSPRIPPDDSPRLIDSKTGRSLTFEQARARTLDISRALHHHFDLAEDEVVAIYAKNDIDFGTTMWATCRLGAIATTAPAAFVGEELLYELKLVHTHHPIKAIIVDPTTLGSAVSALEGSTLSRLVNNVVLLRAPDSSAPDAVKELALPVPTLDNLVEKYSGAQTPPKLELARDETCRKIAYLFFSSGTTGLPKAVALSHYNLVANTLQSIKHYKETFGVDGGSRESIVASTLMAHVMSSAHVIPAHFFLGSSIVIMEDFEVEHLLATVNRFKITLLGLATPQLVSLIKYRNLASCNLNSIRLIFAGAAPLSGETMSTLQSLLPRVSVGQGYGATECTAMVAAFDGRDSSFPGGSAGILCPNVEAKIVSTDGRSLPPDSTGELWVRSPGIAVGYLGNDEATSAAFDSEGFYHTGDECLIDPQGRLYVVDRMKELIKVRANQVSPAELEGHILNFSQSIQDVCVIGIPDEDEGERPKAFVALTPEAKEIVRTSELAEGIKTFVAQHKAEFKRLAAVEFIDAIPKNPLGKRLRRTLREWERAKTQATPSPGIAA